MTEQNPFESKQRIIQEFVPGKQVTMAHLIANPNEDLYKKLGVVSKTRGALGILTITPSEAAIIGADVATKAAEVEIVFVDRFSGSLVVCGDVAAVDAALKDVLRVLGEVLHFTLTDITRGCRTNVRQLISYSQHKTPSFEKPGVRGIISLCD